MSVHGLCFDNGMNGNCGEGCELLILGQCDIGDEIVEHIYHSMTQEEIDVELSLSYEEVKLFIMRGTGAKDLDLLLESYGYKQDA